MPFEFACQSLFQYYTLVVSSSNQFVFISFRGETKKNHHDEDIRLGTLLIPISNLPLEEEIPTVEKWFQFDSVAQGSKVS